MPLGSPVLGLGKRCVQSPPKSLGERWILPVGTVRVYVLWLVVSTHLKNISQIGNLPQIAMKITNVWKHHLVLDWYKKSRVNSWQMWCYLSDIKPFSCFLLDWRKSMTQLMSCGILFDVEKLIMHKKGRSSYLTSLEKGNSILPNFSMRYVSGRVSQQHLNCSGVDFEIPNFVEISPNEMPQLRFPIFSMKTCQNCQDQLPTSASLLGNSILWHILTSL